MTAFARLLGDKRTSNAPSPGVPIFEHNLVWLLIIIGRSARLAVTTTHQKSIEKSNVVALAVAILGAVMFFSSRGVILREDQFLNIWSAIIGAVVVAIQWVDDYVKQQHPKGFGK